MPTSNIRPPQTYADLAHENMHLLAALWRHVIEPLRGVGTRSGNHWRCAECGGMAPVKHAIRHAPGCALFGQDPALLAQLDEWDRMPESV